MFELYQLYSRQDVQRILEPTYNFQPQVGSWGLQGIVSVKASENIVFFVTLDKRDSVYKYQDSILKNGLFHWESQNRQDQSSNLIRKLINHTGLDSKIFLFLRPKKKNSMGYAHGYYYLGDLEYVSHDPNTNNPVKFTWKIKSWNPPNQLIKDLVII